MSCNSILKSKISTVTAGTTSVALTPDNTLSPVNYQRMCLIVTNSAGVTTAQPVTILLNGAQVPVYDRAGNIINGTNLPTRMVLHCIYGTNGAGGTAHMIVVNLPTRCSGSMS